MTVDYASEELKAFAPWKATWTTANILEEKHEKF